MRLWPRLPIPRARTLATSYSGRSIAELAQQPWQGDVLKLFAPTGGIPVDGQTLREFRARLEDAATEAGYPVRSTQRTRRAFDDTVLRLLADYPIAIGEGLRPEMWAWLAVVLVPHLVQWRWPDAERGARIDRFAGSVVRNALGRLWYQSKALDGGQGRADRWKVSDLFGSDQVVALLERPSLAANPDICVAVGTVWAAMPASKRKEDVFREAMKALIVRAAIQKLDVLDKATLNAVVSETFASTLSRLGLE